MTSRVLSTKKALTTKRDDPNFSQVSGYIPKAIALKFKVACTEDEITQSDGLEQAIQLWLAQRKKQQS